MSGSMEANDRVLAFKSGQESVQITFPFDSCVFGVRDCADGFTVSYWMNLHSTPGMFNAKNLSVFLGFLARKREVLLNVMITGSNWCTVGLVYEKNSGEFR